MTKSRRVSKNETLRYLLRLHESERGGMANHPKTVIDTRRGVLFVVGLLLPLILNFSGIPSLAQQPPCSVEINAMVDDPLTPPGSPDLSAASVDSETVTPHKPSANRLRADEVHAQDAGQYPIREPSVSKDCGPRRAVIVVEDDKRMTPAGRAIIAAVIRRVVSEARPQDSVALISARGPRLELPLDSNREAVLAAARRLESPPAGESHGPATIDAIGKAVLWLQPPAGRDAIFVVAMNVEGRHHASISRLRKSLVHGGILVFGFELEAVPQPDPNMAIFPNENGIESNRPAAFIGNIDNLEELTGRSGGFMVGPWEDLTSNPRAMPSQERVDAIASAAEGMYARLCAATHAK